MSIASCSNCKGTRVKLGDKALKLPGVRQQSRWQNRRGVVESISGPVCRVKWDDADAQADLWHIDWLEIAE